MSKNKKDNELVRRLKQDNELAKDPSRRMTFLSLAKVYTDSLEQNLEFNSMDLSNVYMDLGISADEWREFLFFPIVKTYIDNFKTEKMLSAADTAIMGGNPQHALKVKEDIRKRSGEEDRSNFVIFFLPDIEGEGKENVQEVEANPEA